ncbi:MAG: hypothetical protein HFH14_00240 [Lachnospiraceae bacterium]|nr:hypothetical protein [Lachnospiraceae bacterium]
MDQTIIYIEKVSDLVKAISELFYQQKNQEALAAMPSLLDGIMNLSGMISEKEGITEENKQELVKVMGDSLMAMENKDYVLLADILQYDMIETLDRYKDMFV